MDRPHHEVQGQQREQPQLLLKEPRRQIVHDHDVEYRIELHMPGQPVRHARVKLNVPEPPVSDAFMDTRNVWDFVEAEG